MLAQRMSLLSGSGTAAAREATKAAAAAGRQIIDLATGEVASPPPPTVRSGAIAAVEDGRNRYTESIGIRPLREAVAGKISVETGQTWEADEIAITAGAKQGLLDAALALLNPGDEVIIVQPCWPTFPAQVLLAGAKPVFVQAEAPKYVPRLGAIRAAVTPSTKAIVVNSPNNPTGAVYDRTTLFDIADLAVTYDLWIISDECYSGFVFTGQQHQSMASVHPGARSRTVVVNAFSKQLAMTGWRLGYLAAPRELIAASKTLQSHTTSNPNVIAQYAALHHLQTGDGSFEHEMHAMVNANRAAGLKILSGLAVAPPPPAQGTFFFYLDLSSLLATLSRDGTAATGDDISRILLERADVGSVAGGSFGDPNGLRLSFGVPRDQLEPGLTRVVETLNALDGDRTAACCAPQPEPIAQH